MTPITQEAEAVGSKVQGLSEQQRELYLKYKVKRGLGTQLRGKGSWLPGTNPNSIPSMGMEAEREKEEEGKEQRNRGTEGQRLKKENSSSYRVLNYSFLKWAILIMPFYTTPFFAAYDILFILFYQLSFL